MAFYEGGITYIELCNMPLNEVFKIAKCAEIIDKERERKLKSGK